MREPKTLNKETKFVIYGTGEVGHRCLDNLKSNACKVIAALDKYKYGTEMSDGVWIYNLSDIRDSVNIREVVVIICLANGLIHKEIADELYKIGFQYILFLPLGYCMEDKEKSLLTEIYNIVIKGKFINLKIKKYQQYYIKDLNIFNAVIKSHENSYTLWVGMELLFSESLELWTGDKSKIHGKDEIKDKSIALDDPHEWLFAYFKLIKEDYKYYFESYKGEKNNEQINSELSEREKLYRIFQREHNKGINFFIEAAPDVIWNPKGYFNLVGGHHRTMFLLNEGHTLFPIEVKKTDFDTWCHMETYEKFLAYINSHDIEKLYAPVPHPGMINFPVECDEFGETKLKCILRFVAHIDVKNICILDCSRGQGYYARNMERIGAKEAVYIDEDNTNIELALLINELLYRDRVIVKQICVEKVSSDKKYEIVFALDKYSGRLSNPENGILSKLDIITGKYLILETDDRDEIKYIVDNSKFDKYEFLHKEYRYGKIWSLVAFSRG